MNAKKEKKGSKLNRFLDIPEEVGGNVPKITIVGFDELLIENYKGIFEYEEFFIKINTGVGVININGINLNLEAITQDDILVRGKIDCIDVERTVD